MKTPHSEESKAKISAAMMGHEVKQTTRDKISANNKGLKRSEEFKQQRRDTMVAYWIKWRIDNGRV